MYQLHLQRGETLLAVIENLEPVDMFWYEGDFKPTLAFEEVAPLFQEATDTEDVERFGEIYDILLGEMGMVLAVVDADTAITEFVLHIDGKRAMLRY